MSVEDDGAATPPEASRSRGPHKPRDMHRRIWKPSVAYFWKAGGLVVLGIAMIAGGFFLIPSPSRRLNEATPIEEIWTRTETRRLLKLDLVHRPELGLASVTSGPGPMADAPQTGRYAVLYRRNGEAGTVRQNFNAALSLMAAEYAARRERSAAGEAPIPLSPGAAASIIETLENAHNQGTASLSVIRYHQALAHYWARQYADAGDKLAKVDCEGTPDRLWNREDLRRTRLEEFGRIDGMAIACLRLKGHLALETAPAKARDDFWQALTLANRARTHPLYIGAPRLFTLRAQSHMSDLTTADLWAEYLAAAIAARGQPLMPADDQNKAPSGRKLLHPDILALYASGDQAGAAPMLGPLLKLAAALDGRPELVREIQSGREQDAPRPASAMSQTADIFGGVVDDPNAPLPPLNPGAFYNEVSDWLQHNCERAKLKGRDVSCHERSPAFRSWEKGPWLDELRRRDPVGWILAVALWVLGPVAIVAGFAFWRMGRWLGRYREERFDRTFASFHDQESQAHAARAVSP